MNQSWKGEMNMRKYQTLQQIHKAGVVAVLRGKSTEDVVAMAEQSIAGGVRIIEVTMTTPGALEAIRYLAAKYKQDKNPDRPVIGAGTVLDEVTARLAILEGAEFVVSPSFQPGVVKMCHLYRVPVMPGVVTLAEAQLALESGADVVKLFPGSMFTPGIIKTLKGPLPQLNIMPTGGVNLNNIGEWFKSGAFAVGIGSDLTSEAEKTGNYDLIQDKARSYMEAAAPYLQGR
jgi:2-dehydro-3-deoxyphosphogluconate aldolase/(4S)-4-hydroxy-2-oxoglutarate aldolase